MERNINKNDRRNTYVELTAEGERLTEEARQIMADFGKSVMSQVDEADMKHLISYLDNIYHIAEKEIEARKGQGRRKERNMSKIFKNMIPYWKSIVIIIALLFVQAWCDLSLPSYTSDIIDVGIQNYGVEHVVPEALTADEFETAELFMTDEEADLWESIYEQDGDIYRLQVTSESELNEIDDTLAVPLIMNYQMSVMEDSEVKSMLQNRPSRCRYSGKRHLTFHERQYGRYH